MKPKTGAKRDKAGLFFFCLKVQCIRSKCTLALSYAFTLHMFTTNNMLSGQKP